jgi:hypothetical protein
VPILAVAGGGKCLNELFFDFIELPIYADSSFVFIGFELLDITINIKTDKPRNNPTLDNI